ncbi:MAG: tetratricopeptide repeat protein, partial [Endomicrobia bacterium]|nr:tetratricopeptide repeat protein [Endomicrobiia bacterium]
MKKAIVLFLFMVFLSSAAFAQTEAEVIKQANDLIANKKYESAFELLSVFDKENKNPDIVLLKENIALNYFVQSLMHQGFAFKDIEQNENITDYRGRAGEYHTYLFPVDKILANLIKTYPDNCKLYKGLGEFYYEVYLKYGDNWLSNVKHLNKDELFKLIQANLQKAVDGKCADYLSYYSLAEINLVQGKDKESIPYFLKSIELNKDFGNAHYNLAYAYFGIGDFENALKYAKNALALYADPGYKGDAARMIGSIYKELGDDKNALENYESADKIDPKNYYTLKSLLEMYLKTDNNKCDETAKAFFHLAPDNSTTYDDIEEIYRSYNKESKLADFYKSQFPAFKNNEKVQGSLNFYLGRLYVESDKKA